MEEKMTISEVCEYAGVRPQAIYLARRSGKLKGMKEKFGRINRYYFLQSDVDDYIKNKYNPELKKTKEGDIMYNKKKGIYSPSMLAREWKISVQRIYHWIYIGQLPAEKYRMGYRIQIKEFLKVFEKYREWDEKNKKGLKRAITKYVFGLDKELKNG